MPNNSKYLLFKHKIRSECQTTTTKMYMDVPTWMEAVKHDKSGVHCSVLLKKRCSYNLAPVGQINFQFDFQKGNEKWKLPRPITMKIFGWYLRATFSMCTNIRCAFIRLLFAILNLYNIDKMNIWLKAKNFCWLYSIVISVGGVYFYASLNCVWKSHIIDRDRKGKEERWANIFAGIDRHSSNAHFKICTSKTQTKKPLLDFLLGN